MKTKLFLMLTVSVMILAISGCGSGSGKNGPSASGVHEEGGSGSPDDPGKESAPGAPSGDSYFDGFVESADVAILKNSKDTYTLIGSKADHWMTLENNSRDSIHITGARVEVEYYEPIPSEGYVVRRTGDGDSFDSYWGLYSEVGSSTGSYDAYRVDLDEYGYMIDGTVNWDPVFREDLAANDSKNIRFFVVFQAPGIYKYNLIIDFDYNGKKEHVSSDFAILHDDDYDRIERGVEEFDANFDEYNF